MRSAAVALLGFLAASATYAQGDGVRTASYAQPSTLYGHDALGPGHEWSALRIEGDEGPILFQAGPDLVFEDIAPRLADLDGDGNHEAIVVEASLVEGARLAVWSTRGRIAATPFIGQRHRWLAPAGVADLDGDGTVEVAYVETPHLGRRLKVVRLEAGRLVPVAEAAGLTNHRFADPFIQGRIVPCGRQTFVLTASADWTRIVATTLMGGELRSRSIGPYLGPDSFSDSGVCD